MKLNPPLSVAGLCFFLMMGISWQVGAYDEVDLEKLKATGDCSGCDLSKANLTGANLYGADLTGANLTKAILELAILEVADLTKAILTGANLTGASLHYANLTGTIFCRTRMPDESINDSGC